MTTNEIAFGLLMCSIGALIGLVRTWQSVKELVRAIKAKDGDQIISETLALLMAAFVLAGCVFIFFEGFNTYC